jgi:NitT/TauT family transport system permease protein
LLDLVAPSALVAVLLVAWQLLCMVWSVPDYLLPRPSVIADALWTHREPIAWHAGFTLGVTMIGFVIALLIGGALGIGIGTSRLFHKSVYPLLIAFNAMPKVAIVPIMVIWFGSGALPASITAFLVAFLPVTVNLAAGLSTVEPEMRDVLRAVGARRRDLILKVGLPHAAPYFFASLKLAISMAFVGAVISETVAAERGIGYLMISASSRLQVPLVFAGLFVVAALATTMYAVFALFERRLLGQRRRDVQEWIGG